MTGKIRFGVLAAIMLIAALGYAYFGNSGSDLISENRPQESSGKQSAQKANQEEPKMYEAPEFTLLNLDGDEVSLSDYRGKVVFINFWATWCGPCRQEVPAFVELQEEFGKDKLVILGISVDQGDLSVVPAFADEYGMNYEVLYSTPRVQAMYGGISSIPVTFVVDKDGYLRDGRVGFPGKDYFKSVINALL